MAHQDRGSETESIPLAEQLREAFVWLMRPEAFQRIQFRKDCSWTPWLFAATAILWVWSGEPTLRERFETARRITQESFGTQVQLAGSYQAWMKMLVHWTSDLLQIVVGAMRKRMQRRFPATQIAGWNVFAVDGTRGNLARTRSNQETFCPQSSRGKKKRKGKKNASRRKKAENPQVWMTTLWHVGLGLPWAWRSGPSDSSERKHLLEMLPSLRDASMITGDAGFVGYLYWKAVVDAGHSFVIRVGSNVKLLKGLGHARCKNGLVYLWPDAVAAKGGLPLTLRLVVVHDGKHPVYLVTNVLDAKSLSDEDVATIYRHRWGIEVYYRGFKQTFGQHKFRSRKAENVYVEVDWAMAGLAVACLYAQHCGHIPRGKLSVAGVLRAIRRAIHHYRHVPDVGDGLKRQLARAIIDSYERSNKTARDYPRKKQETPAGAPKLIPATLEQVRLAQQLQREHAMKGLTA